MAKRAGVDLMNVSDSEVIGWLTSRGIRPQFLSDYQPLYAAAPATRWPANLEFTVCSPGRTSIDGGSIDLGVVRDSVLNETNDFTAAWSEQFFQVARSARTPARYSVTLDVDGVTGCCPAA